jgi:hypothetical protein
MKNQAEASGISIFLQQLNDSHIEYICTQQHQYPPFNSEKTKGILKISVKKLMANLGF